MIGNNNNNNNNSLNNNNNNDNNSNNINNVNNNNEENNFSIQQQFYSQRRNSLTYNMDNSNGNNNELAGGGNHTLTEYEYRDADYDSNRDEEEEEDIISSINENTTETKSLLEDIRISSSIDNIISINEVPTDHPPVIVTIKDDKIITTTTTTITTTTTKKHTKPQGMCYDGRRNYILMVDAVVALVFVPIVYFSYYIPNLKMDHNEEVYKYWYYNIPFSKYALWMFCVIGGFAYVSVITEKRSVPFHCRYKRHRDFFQLLFAASLWFAIGGPSRALFGRNDYIVGLDDHITKNTQDGYSAAESFFYNYFAFFLSFLLGLHFTYLDRNLFLRSMGDKFGTPMLWKTFKASELMALIPVLLFILAMAALHIYLIIQDKLWEYFAIAYSIFFAVLIGVSLVFRKTHYLHMHHYFIFGSLVPLTGFQTVLSLISLGAVSGIAVEGVSRWSMGWLWYRGSRVL
ncbi:hypothetical protein DICPUDRAFT_154633 [Dictyostelium purpureum]|uniref:Uncharacterized protein n=1 Tax=Dictyostelium purpureum TaxID=5786 RepID=F0ZRU9_DICPU|nr:uncharacterized protein DICPUDRAFT_154633 [Dictyostelium purpureum]EGC33333.1 hypothetical protein DICPUDRAFT_154633 [Dictyostelium purpureum]|eukprot:XP_003290149.1 hypothetical protein DICPUDRAFT_154633 [Dictyostelium purpureum]